MKQTLKKQYEYVDMNRKIRIDVADGNDFGLLGIFCIETNLMETKPGKLKLEVSDTKILHAFD